MAIITFADADGVEQTLDTEQKFNVAYHVDCRVLMQALPDKCFDLCCTDPPYGDGLPQDDNSQSVNVERERDGHHGPDTDRGRTSSSRTERGDMPSGGKWNRFGQRFDRYKETASPIPRGDRWNKYLRAETTLCQPGGWHGKFLDRNGSPDGRDVGGEVRKKIIAWDVAPEKEVFDEIFRVSRHQVIWGGNYFSLPPARCFLIWRKLTISESFSMAMAEYAWTSYNANAKVYECAPQGKVGDPRFHATQKPIDLYRWIYGMFTKPGMTVFDPFLGSGSSRIAAYEAGLNFIGCEIDPGYFQKQEERFERMTAQMTMFSDRKLW